MHNCLFPILCIFCFCIVLCIVSSLVHSRLFPISVHDHCHQVEAQLQSFSIIYHVMNDSYNSDHRDLELTNAAVPFSRPDILAFLVKTMTRGTDLSVKIV